MGAGAAGHERGEGVDDAARAALAARLRARHEEIGEAIFARIRERRFDPAGSEDAEYVAGLRAATVAGLDYVLNALAPEPRAEPGSGSGPGSEKEPEAAGLGPPVPAVALEQARRAARVGVSLDTVLRRYVAGYTLLGECIVREAERDERLRGGTAQSDALATASVLVERLIAAVSKAYRRQAELDRRSRQSARGGPGRGSPTHRGLVNGGAAHGAGAGALPGVGVGEAVFEAEGALGVGAGVAREVEAQLERSRRERIMGALVEVVAERGYTDTSVGQVVDRSGMSRRTFYDVFPGGTDEGLIAVMDWALEQTGALAGQRLEEGETWQEGVRGALAALLAFFDSDRALAQVCFVETLAGPAVREHRERNVRAFRALIVARIEQAGVPVPPLAAEVVMASLMNMIYSHLVSSERAPLIELLGQLTGATVTPFVSGEAPALEEKRRGEALAREIAAGDPAWAIPSHMTRPGAQESIATPAAEGGEGGEAGAASSLPQILANPAARRPRECLLFLARRVAEGCPPSNGEIADGIGVAHRSQISLLLSELADEGLVVRHSEGAGKRNAWRLTERGKEAVQKL